MQLGFYIYGCIYGVATLRKNEVKKLLIEINK